MQGVYGSVKSDILILKESSLEVGRVQAGTVQRSEKAQRFMECIKTNEMALRIMGSEMVRNLESTYQYELDNAIRSIVLPIEDD